MKTTNWTHKLAHIGFATLGATLALAFLLVFLAHTRIHATGVDPALEAITVSATLPLSDTQPGADITRSVYFNNSAAGDLTVTLQISGTPALTLTAGAAFGEPERTYTSSTSSLVDAISYTISTAHNSPHYRVPYVVTNANGVRTMVTITYVRDITPPVATITAPDTGAVLTTALSSVSIVGEAQDNDGGSGVRRIQVTTDSGSMTADGTTSWSSIWPLPVADNATYTISARAEDYLAAVQSTAATRTVIIDTVAPSAADPTPARSPWATSTIVYTWPDSVDNAGIAGYQVNVTNTAGYSHLLTTAGPTLTFTEALAEGADYAARVRAWDGNQNLGAWSGFSPLVTPDLTAPDISNPSIAADSDSLYVAGTSLYYVNTMPVPTSFTVQGNASDGLSGPSHATFSQAFGQKPPDDGSPAAFAGIYDVPVGATESGTISATIYDQVGNASVQTYTYALDSTPPDSLASAEDEYASSSPINITWVATDTQSGVYSTTLWYQRAGAWQPGPTLPSSSGTFEFYPPEGDGLYLFATVAADNLGNAEAGPPVSETQTLYDTTISPTIGLTATPAVWTNVNAFTVNWNNPDDSSRIVGAYYKLNTAPTANDDGTWQPGQDLEQITGITVTGDGIHPIYVWLKDKAGNVDYMTAQSTSLRYDATSPASVVITAEERISATHVPISWLAKDATSGILSYTVEYSAELYSTWQALLTNTTETSATFTVPQTDTTYIFRVTASDEAGNKAFEEATIKVGPLYVYLPLIFREWDGWYQFDLYEPNNSREQAQARTEDPDYEPLASDQEYKAYIWNERDRSDYYLITVTDAQPIEIDLWNIPDDCDYDLYLYDSPTDPSPIAFSNQYGSVSEYIRYPDPAAGTYYVRIYAYSGFANDQPYSFRIRYK